ncbi:MAG: DUF5946 family protein [Bacteroidota bacterium]
MEEYIPCFSCGAKSLNFEGDGHEYMLASAGCYEMFNEVLEKEYSDFRYSKAHHYTVDSYAVQHPGEPLNQKAINSVGIHLVSLYFLLEEQYDLAKSAKIKMEFAQFNKTKGIIHAIKRPEKFDGITIFEIWDNENPDEHFDLCKQWALDSWTSWKNHHATIEKWANIYLMMKI